ncbi:hypothetical protein LK994_09475 [Ferruginibacter lapsinanis]|uniref:hypothetical protein n=1 Tax=Ferruginibacter lapsinanis TaxID=563172 RepID=UPI001E5640A4|nr:hypothetical protein [Ferruginibacter lapsinanis]UEG48866.1 hypothetical protein LK994_09475 [Ferruginibacter lapsinanis]
MIIEIDDTKTIELIQDKFSEFFPFLKIEFYEHPHHWYKESSKTTILPGNKTIGEIRKHHHQGDMEIHSWYRTGDLEQSFRKKFNLNVQVFRLHGTEWVQTVGTDKLTLEEQNDIGRKATLEVQKVADSPTANRNLF